MASGPFPTEQSNAAGETLQNQGHEYGVTTGRKRRCGWLDLVMLKYSHAVNDYTAFNLTKLDVLDSFAEIPVAVEYQHDGAALESVPANPDVLASVQVRYQVLPGWQTPTAGAKKWDDLPAQARAYVDFVERFVGVPIRWVGVGPGREDMIVR